MAYVAISGDFKDRVTTKIQLMERAELNSIGQEPPIMLSPDTPSVLNTVWKEHLNIKHITPKEWGSETDTLNAKFEIPLEDGKSYSHCFSIKLTDKIHTPPNFYRHQHEPVDHTATEYTHLLAWVMKKQEINFRWKKVLNQVQHFLGSCKSANEAVKLWPEITMYFDDQDIRRLNVKHAREASTSSAAEALKSIDTAELTGAAVIARMSGAV